MSNGLKSTKIQFELDPDFSVLGVGVDLFDRLGLVGLIDNYQIISLNYYRWIKEFRKAGVKVFSLQEINPDLRLSRNDIDHIALTREFKDIVSQFQNSAILVYKSTEVIEKVSEKLGLRVIANSYKLRQKFENKHLSREMFDSVAKFPSYFTFDKTEVEISPRFFDEMKIKLGKFVIQDEIASGGKGTFFIKDYNDFKHALIRLKDLPGNKVVFSKFIDGDLVSIYGCITKYGVLLGESYRQVVSDPGLLNSDISGEGRYCGAEFGYYRGCSSKVISKVRRLVKIIGRKLEKSHYQGIFGLDTIVDSSGEVYLVEINPRLTGTANFLTILQLAYGEVPLVLLHTLELGDIKYWVKDPSIFDEYGKGKQFGTYLILHNKESRSIRVKKTLKPGIYDISGDFLKYSHFSYRFDRLKKNQVLLMETPERGSVVDEGKRIMRILTRDKVLDSRGKVNKKFFEMIRYLESQYIY